MKDIFKKMAELTPEDRSKVKGYWTPLWGAEFSKALTEDYMTSGKKKEVKAGTSSKKKS